MSAYHALEILVLSAALLISLWMAAHRLLPRQVEHWRRSALLWMISRSRPAFVRETGIRWARGSVIKDSSGSCGSCSSCEPPKRAA